VQLSRGDCSSAVVPQDRIRDPRDKSCAQETGIARLHYLHLRARYAVSRLMILAPRIRVMEAVAEVRRLAWRRRAAPPWRRPDCAEEQESLHGLFEFDHLF
jgi:hypothetical protein